MWKRIGILGFSLLVGLLILVGGGQIRAQADDVTSSMNGLDSPATVEVNSTGKNGDWQELTSGAPLESGNYYFLHYSWSIINGKTINSGDTATITVPKNCLPSDASGAIKDSTNEVIGSFRVNSEKNGVLPEAHIMFSTDIKDNYNRHGTVSFYAGGSDKNTTAGKAVISKNGWVQESRGSNGIPTQMTWDIDFNSLHQDLGKVTLTDTLGDFQTYDPAKDKITVLQVTDSDGTKESDSESAKYMPKVSVDSSGKIITFEFPNIDSKEITIWYTSTVSNSLSGSGGSLGNGVSMISATPTTGDEGTGNGTGAADNPAKIIKNSFWGGYGDYQGEYRRTIVLTKTGVNGVHLGGAVYTLTGPDGTEYQGTTDKNGKIFWSNMVPGNYTYVEDSAPDGYAVDSAPYKATITANDGPDDLSVSASDKLEESSDSSSNNSSDTGSSNDSNNSNDSGSSGSTETSNDSNSASNSDSSDSSDSTSNSGSSNTSSTSTSSTKAKRTTVANVASSDSSSTIPRKGGTAAGTTANAVSKAAKHHTNTNNYLPRTNGQRSLLAMLVGFLILGLSLAASKWRKSHAKS